VNITPARLVWAVGLFLLAVSSLGNKYYFAFGLAILAMVAVTHPEHRYPKWRNRTTARAFRVCLTALAVTAFAIQAA
jgi:hypothetical protein